jgi:hypothetical protein
MFDKDTEFGQKVAREAENISGRLMTSELAATAEAEAAEI